MNDESISTATPAPRARMSADASPWLTPTQAATYAQIGRRAIYREVRAGRLRAARIGGKGEIRILRAWLDDFLVAQATPIVTSVSRRRA
jgi:excisionase family DNA binding protein